MRVLSVASEVFPLIKTGGLADVAGALPRALQRDGIAMTTCLPAYGKVKAALTPDSVSAPFRVLGFEVRLIHSAVEGLGPVIGIDCPELFERAGGPYGDQSGRDWPDNGTRFAVFAKAAASIATGAIGDKAFDLVHAHDWQAGLVPAYLHYGRTGIPSLMTIHNIAFQGRFDASLFGALELPGDAMGVGGVEYYGGVGFLKAGLNHAHAISTVSPTYAREILSPAFGMGLEGLINTRRDALHGIVNGLDTDHWDPETDPHLAQTYSIRTLAGRRANRAALLGQFGLDPSAEGPLLGIVSRLTSQKGMDVVASAADAIVAMGARLVILGAGDPDLEYQLGAAAARNPGHIGLVVGYDEALAHLIHGGTDMLLVPSRFEPCGLTQLSAQRYGTVPVVARTGGLADTVIDANHAAVQAGVATGFQFSDVGREQLIDTIKRAITMFADARQWSVLQRNGMRADVTWTASGRQYATLYRSLIR